MLLNDCSSRVLPGYCLSSRGHCSCQGPRSGAVQAFLPSVFRIGTTSGDPSKIKMYQMKSDSPGNTRKIQQPCLKRKVEAKAPLIQ